MTPTTGDKDGEVDGDSELDAAASTNGGEGDADGDDVTGETDTPDETEDANAGISPLSVEQDAVPVVSNDSECQHEHQDTQGWNEPTGKAEPADKDDHWVYFTCHGRPYAWIAGRCSLQGGRDQGAFRSQLRDGRDAGQGHLRV